MPIRTIEGKRDLKRFLEPPYRLYKDDPVWVPPLRGEQAKQLDPKYNPMLARCEHALFLLEDHRGVITLTGIAYRVGSSPCSSPSRLTEFVSRPTTRQTV